VLFIGVSVLQYLQRGEITWPTDLYHRAVGTVSDYPTRPDAAWRKAADKLGELGASREGKPTPDFDLQGRVVKIIDGDSLSLLEAGGRQHTIRLFGIDTPEWDQPHGKAAKRALAKLVDQKVIGVVAVDTDTFGRTVGTVYLGQRDINLAMVESGHAWWFTRYAPYERHLAAAEEQAREDRIGLWAADDPVPPWHWRRNKR
jgi:endonuclease YncB( thermonuclease family)